MVARTPSPHACPVGGTSESTTPISGLITSPTCGEFPNLGDLDSGLASWTAQNRSIENTDVVLWYVFGIHRITRPEDWPIMPVDTVSFWLKPFGFFDRNPALDVPPSRAECHD